MIEAHGLRVRRGRHLALAVDELRIAAGVTALVGSNGSGKSTLLHTIAGLLEPEAGSIDVLGGRPADVRARVAYVLQAQHASEHLLVTAREVVALARAAVRGPFSPLRAGDRAAIDQAMARLEVTELGHRHLAEMSGGERQRVFVAQGLAQGADVLLLDEPMAGLDLASAQGIGRVITEERDAGRTVLVATHDLDQAVHADNVVLLNRAVVAAGRPEDVLVPERLRQAYGARVLELGGEQIAVDDGVHHDDHEHHHFEHHDVESDPHQPVAPEPDARRR